MHLLRSCLLALCVLIALGASVAKAETPGRGFSLAEFSESLQQSMHDLMAPLTKPITPPVPMPKPVREAEAETEAPEPDTRAESGPGLVAECGYASIVSTLDGDGETLIYRATFAPGMVDAMVGEGCGQFFQGCNVCTVLYRGCTDAERDACTDVDCLEKTCERRVRCSTKTCQISGRAPGCDARLARTSCLRKTFE